MLVTNVSVLRLKEKQDDVARPPLGTSIENKSLSKKLFSIINPNCVK